jgi:hypothetical protein
VIDAYITPLYSTLYCVLTRDHVHTAIQYHLPALTGGILTGESAARGVIIYTEYVIASSKLEGPDPDT